MKARERFCTFAAALALCAVATHTFGAGFTDPLDQAARPSALASRTPLLSVARAGERVVAVGQRGHIVYSDDHGDSWQQAAVPSSSDLTSVFFVNARTGWAVGHDGLILRSKDGGATWIKQLDGRQLNTLLVADLEKKMAVGGDTTRIERLLGEAIRYREAGPDKPFLDVWFADENQGFAVGAYGLIFRTRDGGNSWESWFDRVDNPGFFHLNAVRGLGDRVYVVGEQGLFLRLDGEGQRFVADATPYQGSFFALAVTRGGLTAFGMRGAAYRTPDQGRSWHKIETGMGSGLSGATVLDDGRIVVVSQAGKALLSRDDGASFTVLDGVGSMPFAAVAAAGEGRIALAGMHGVQIEHLP